MRRSSPYFAFFVCTNGIYEFRAGRYAEAIETLREVETTQFPAPMTFAAAALAMANHKLGYAEIAKSELLHAQKLLRTFWPRTEGGPRVALGDSLYAYLLVKEAEEMILRN